MADYSDLKISPKLRDVLETAAEETYDGEYPVVSRAGHEAAIAFLILRVDPADLTTALNEHGFEDLPGLISYLSDEDGGDGRFSKDPHFDPMAAMRTPRNLTKIDDE